MMSMHITKRMFAIPSEWRPVVVVDLDGMTLVGKKDGEVMYSLGLQRFAEASEDYA